MPNSPVARARSFLFVPASRPERFAKALNSAADCIIVDLEDAIAPDQKSSARDNVADCFPAFGRAQLARTLVRINAVGTQWHGFDLRLAADWAAHGLAGVVMPKAESAAGVRAAGVALGPSARLVPLIESLAGLDAVDAIARTPQVARLAFGHLDFQLDLGMRCQREESELDSVRFAIVAASRRGQLAPAIDGVTTATADRERLLADAQRSRAFGFGAKLCIHPAQAEQVNQVFSPSASDLELARRVVAAARMHQGNAFRLEGRMVDLPVIRLAQQVLRAADGPRQECE